MDTLCRDERLNISSAYLKPGFAFGGSCLPKDLRALTYRAMHMDLKLPLLESVLPSNQRHLEGHRPGARFSGRIGIFGLAFKEDTDDLRESPVVPPSNKGGQREGRQDLRSPHPAAPDLWQQPELHPERRCRHIGRLLVSGLEEVSRLVPTPGSGRRARG